MILIATTYHHQLFIPSTRAQLFMLVVTDKNSPARKSAGDFFDYRSRVSDRYDYLTNALAVWRTNTNVTRQA